MEPLDQYIAETLADDSKPEALFNSPAGVLLVGGNAEGRKRIVRTLCKRGLTCTWASGVCEARSALARQTFDVVLLNCSLDDGSSIELCSFIQKVCPFSKTIMLAEGAGMADAVGAMRAGAIDLLQQPLDLEELAARVDSAVLRCRADRCRDERLTRLKKVCEELNIARHEISKQVDSLCNDLATVYEDVAAQMTEVAMASEFRTLCKQELDVEDLLRTTLEYMLTKTGPTNAAVFLPDAGREPGSYGLGAYVNYDCPRQTVALMLDHLCQAICPQMADESDIVSFADAREFAEWIGGEAGFFAQSQVIAFACRPADGGECMAVFVLFRDKAKPFDDQLASTLDLLREIIAEQLRHVIRVHHRAKLHWPKEAADGDLDDLGFGYEGGRAA